MTAIPPQIVSAQDYIDAAARLLPADVWGYLGGAGADGITRGENRRALQAIRLRGRVLGDLAQGHTRLNLMGLDLPHPILMAPTATHHLAHPEGEGASLLGAAAAGALSVVSCQASTDMATLAVQAQGPLWFQLYLQPRREDTARLVARAQAAGYRALVVTVDAPVNGLRNEEVRAGFRLPPGIGAVNLAGFAAPQITAGPGESPVFRGLMQAAPRWADIAWLRGLTRLPILLKGIMEAEDALVALDHGVDGLIVSNHGGRVLDGLPATITVLPEVVAAVAGRVPVLMDGGIRRGTDILAALALGAQAVLVGLPVLAALAVGGTVGVAHLFTLLRAELEVAMALTGCATLPDITPKVLRP